VYKWPINPFTTANSIYSHTYYVVSGVRNGWIGDRSKKLYHHTMEMEQMKAEIRTNQAKADTSLNGYDGRNESQSRTFERGHAGQVKCPS
jgi:hypothetical protein